MLQPEFCFKNVSLAILWRLSFREIRMKQRDEVVCFSISLFKQYKSEE